VYSIAKPAMTGKHKHTRIADFILNLCAAQEARRMMMNCSNPKGIFNKDVKYLLKPSPFRIRGPKVFVTEAPTFNSKESPTQRYVFGSSASSRTCDHLNSRLPVPVWFARSRSMAFGLSDSDRKRADGMSLSSLQ